ncbi:MAG: glycine cleavage system protein GcvH [Porphyromonas sp.]|nr:glycine cleavage system protein GcvH [Bacteroidales bacterium]MDY3100088.1 glycine cleavage system protein GcvH [Porphyromonas sp.]
MNYPANLKYTKDHEWLLINGSEVTIGITDYAQSELGDIVFVDIPTEGESVEAGEAFGSIEAVKTVSDLLTPVALEDIQFNSELEDAPELVNQDPYGKGWIIKATLADADEASGLLSAADYEALL